MVPETREPLERIRSAVAAHAPELEDLEILELGRGLDNTAFIVGDLVLRVANGPGVAREARLLAHLAPCVSIPIPAPRFADEDAGVMAYRRIPGHPLLGRRVPGDAPARLGRFLRELHGVDPEAVEDLVVTEDADPGAWLRELDGPRELIAALRAGRPRRSRERVVAHADLGAEHILEAGGTLTGVIDWTDAAITDPALDLARLYRDFGPAFLEELLGTYGPVSPGTRSRIEFFARCAALEDLAYGRETGRREYVINAERSFAWLFPDADL